MKRKAGDFIDVKACGHYGYKEFVKHCELSGAFNVYNHPNIDGWRFIRFSRSNAIFGSDVLHSECTTDLTHLYTLESRSDPDELKDAMAETKPARYQRSNDDDWIDECFRTMTPEQVRGAMRFMIGKYSRRMGKKDDLVSEIRKMEDYCRRWAEYEEAQNEG